MNNMNELAEICGIHAGDGYLRNDGKRTELDISGSIEEKPYYDNHVIPIIFKAFNIKIIGKVFYPRNTYGFVIRNKNIIRKIHEIGFPYGKKTTNLRIPKFIMLGDQKVKHLFLRGIFDTDGCISFDRRYQKSYSPFKRKYHTYPRITLSTISENFLKDLQKLINSLDIKYWTQTYISKYNNEHKKFIIWVRGKNIEKWMKIVGSKNPIKLTRYKIWKKHGFCPANISYKERLKILNNQIDPRSFYGSVV